MGRNPVFYFGFAVFLDPRIGPEAQEILMVPIGTAPDPFLFLVICMYHTDRAPGKLFRFLFLHNDPYEIVLLLISLGARYVPFCAAIPVYVGNHNTPTPSSGGENVILTGGLEDLVTR